MKAVISKASPRYKDWLDVFGTDTVEILEPTPIQNQGPEGEDMFYLLDLRQLSLKQKSRMVNFLCRRWKMSHEEVMQALGDPLHGLPIQAKDVVVALDLKLFT